MSKNFRKEGQPEKERLAKITGMDIDKVKQYLSQRSESGPFPYYYRISMLIYYSRYKSGSKTAVRRTDYSRTGQWEETYLSAIAPGNQLHLRSVHKLKNNTPN